MSEATADPIFHGECDCGKPATRTKHQREFVCGRCKRLDKELHADRIRAIDRVSVREKAALSHQKRELAEQNRLALEVRALSLLLP